MAKQKKKAPQKSSPKSKGGIWARNYYIRGFGSVRVGEVVSAASLEAWKAYSPAEPKINYVTENNSSESSD